MSENKKYSSKQILKFVIPSIIGIGLFMMPVPYNGSYNIPIAIVTSKATKLLAPIMPYFVYIVIMLSAIGYILYKTVKPKFITDHPFLVKLVDTTPVYGAIRIFAAVMAVMLAFGFGPEVLVGPDTGIFVVNEFLKSFITTIFFAGTLMTLLLDFGFMEFIGVLISKFFRKVFTLPGRSAIDCITSWLGDAVVAVLVTSDQYDRGYYSAREASVITTTFSAVSISFTLVIVSQLALDHMFFPFFYTTLCAGIICAVIMPRIPPLSIKKNTYTVDGKAVEGLPHEGRSITSLALETAVKRAESENFNIVHFLKNGLSTMISCGFSTIPIVLVVGSVTLAFNYYTPVFTWLGYPFYPILELLGVPEAMDAASCLLAGFGDNFVPAVIASSSIENEMTRFIVGSISINQLIYMSQVGALILGSKIPVKFVDLFIIFIERTILSVVIITLIAKFIVF